MAYAGALFEQRLLEVRNADTFVFVQVSKQKKKPQRPTAGMHRSMHLGSKPTSGTASDLILCIILFCWHTQSNVTDIVGADSTMVCMQVK